LAPRLVEQIRDIVVDINGQGTSVLLVEQNATMALAIAGYGLVLEQGRVVRSGPGDELLADRNIREFYLGMSPAAERRSFRDVKTYRRRKSWGA
jgi:branched-chain amino acid transport system ATP-binding protein